jgi:prevent-host-death family protein
MKRTISAGEARKRLGELLEGVYYRGDEVIIERAGRPMAVVIPSSRYEGFQRQRKVFLDMIEEITERSKTPEERAIEVEIDAAIREVRTERRAREAVRKAV